MSKDKIDELYAERNERSKSLIKDAFEFKTDKSAPYIINTANYFLFGYSPDEIPEDYCQNPSTMYERQIGQFQRHFDLVDDSFVPYLMPWYGTAVLASGFGIKMSFPFKMDPTADPLGEYAINEPSDIDKLDLPDPTKDGLMPKVVETIKYFQEHSNLPINFTDNHGPLTTAVQILGYEKLFYWFQDYPKKIHQLMDIISDAVIMWVKYQKELIGEPLDHCIGNQGIYVPEGTGVWFSDDDAVIISTEHYREFVAPYNDKICKAFGTGIVHFCGNGNQHIESFKSMKYLRGLNNFALADWKALLKLKSELEGKVVIVACDFVPLEYENYYTKLFVENNMSKRGIVLQSLFAPTTAVKDQRYELIDREEKEVVPQLDSILGRLLKNGS
jgi:uroporphyrinogen-III decarboxylase